MILEGRNVSVETIKYTNNVEKVILKEGFKDPIFDVVKQKKIPYEIMKQDLFKKRYPHSQGIVCITKEYQYAQLRECLARKKENSVVLILDGVEDPENFGNMIRTFEALGGDFIIIPKNRSVSMTETVARVSAGSYVHVNICQVNNLSNTISELKEHGYWVFGTDMKGSVDYDSIHVDTPLAFVIGSEGFGMSRLVREQCDYLVNIPMVGKINSLNASITSAIVLSSIMSRRKTK